MWPLKDGQKHNVPVFEDGGREPRTKKCSYPLEAGEDKKQTSSYNLQKKSAGDNTLILAIEICVRLAIYRIVIELIFII